MNLVVPLEMVDYALSSVIGSTTIFNRSKISLTSDDYDGAVYFFEIVAINLNVSVDYNVNLYDVTSSAVKATITVPKNTTYPTRFLSSSWTSTDSTKRVYAVRTPQTAVAEQVIVCTARIIVVQTSATKTRIQIPLINHSNLAKNFGDTYSASAIWSTTSLTYTQTTYPNYATIFNKNSLAYSEIAGWSFEAVIGVQNGSSGKKVFATLWNMTDNVQVAASEITHTGNATPTLVESNEFSNFATDFDDGNNFEVKIKSDFASSDATIGRACLYARLVNLAKAEIIWRVSKYSVFSTITELKPERTRSRVLLNTSSYSDPFIYFEATGIRSSGVAVYLRDHLTNDSGLDGSNVTNSGLTFNSATKIRKRSSALTLTDGNRFYTEGADESTTVSSTWIVVNSGRAPVVTSQSDDMDVVEEEEANLFVVAGGAEPFSYQWYKDDVLLDGKTNSTLSFIASVETGGTYKCEVSNEYGIIWSGPIVVTVLYYPEITSQSQNQTIAKGQLVSLYVVATGTPPLEYEWYQDDEEMLGETNSTLSFYAGESDAGIYKCKVSNVVDNIWSDPIVLTVVDNPYTWNPFNLNLDINRETT